MNVRTSKSGSSPMVPMAPRAVCTFAAALGGAPGGAPVGLVELLVAGAAQARGLMGRVMVRPFTAPSYEASCPGSYTPPKMDSHWEMHSNLRPERCTFTHPRSFQWRNNNSQWERRIKRPPGPEKSLAYVKSQAQFDSGMGDRGFPARGFHAHARPPPVPRAPPLPLVATAWLRGEASHAQGLRQANHRPVLTLPSAHGALDSGYSPDAPPSRALR